MTPSNEVTNDLRGFSFAILKNDQILSSGSNPKLAPLSESMTLTYQIYRAQIMGGDLVIGGIPDAEKVEPITTHIFGLSWEDIQRKQQKRLPLGLPQLKRMPTNAVVIFSSTDPSVLHQFPNLHLEHETTTMVSGASYEN